jgi:hypothetical protein
MLTERLSKMTRINKTQQYAIQWLDSNRYDHKKISKELNIPEVSVTNFLEKNRVFNTKTNIKTSSSAAGTIKDKNLVITEQNISKSIRDKSAIFKPVDKNKRR